MGDWEAALHWAANRVVMRSLQLVFLGLGCILGEPDVFENYFDDELRFVDVPQEVVLKACLANGDDTVKKIQKAYDKCFGKDYSFDDLADTVGRDSDNDELPDEYEANEGCFYKTMDWVKGNQVQPSVVEADMAGLPDFDSFKDDINSCSAWSGNFGGREKKIGRKARRGKATKVRKEKEERLKWEREKRKEIIMPTKRRGQGKEAKKGKVKEVTKRRATTGKGQGKAIKRGNKATGRTREKTINKRKMIKTRARKKDEVERIPSCCLSSFTINSGASTWPWNRL